MEALPETSEEYVSRYGVNHFLHNLTGGVELRISKVFEPTCTICGLTSGYQGAGSKTVLPARASAKVDFRLVPDQTPEQVLNSLRLHLDSNGFSDITINFLGGEQPARTAPDDPFVALVLGLLYAALGAAVLALLSWRGWDYYLAAARERLRLPLHASLKSAGPWGHGVGIAATPFMLVNFLYAARKRVRPLSGLGDIRLWLLFHVFVGFMSPLVIAFHAAFQSKNLLASATAIALRVVVATGVVGRFIYALVPSSGGKALEVEDLQGSFVRARAEIEPLLALATDSAIPTLATSPSSRMASIVARS